MINVENGLPLCENCLTDCEPEEMIDLIMNWDSDTEYAQIAMCPGCAVRLAWQAKRVILPKESKG